MGSRDIRQNLRGLWWSQTEGRPRENAIDSSSESHAHKTPRVSAAKHPSKIDAEKSAREVLALNLIRHRAARGWSQEALAFEANLHRTFVAHVERQARNISLDNLERLAIALNLRPYQRLKK